MSDEIAQARATLNDRLGRVGYTMVARAPEIGLDAMADGSWHVLAGSSPDDPDRIHDIDRDLIPFILEGGGDIVLYRLSLDDGGEPRPVLSRGGMAGRPPSLAYARPFDPAIADGLNALRAKAKPAPKPAPAPEPSRVHWWAAGAAAAVLVALMAGGGWYATRPEPRTYGATTWVPNKNDPREVAQSKGATVVIRPSKTNPNRMEMVRIYPDQGDGGRNEDFAGDFSREDWDKWDKSVPVPDSALTWRRMR